MCKAIIYLGKQSTNFVTDQYVNQIRDEKLRYDYNSI